MAQLTLLACAAGFAALLTAWLAGGVTLDLPWASPAHTIVMGSGTHTSRPPRTARW